MAKHVRSARFKMRAAQATAHLAPKHGKFVLLEPLHGLATLSS